MTVSSTTKPVVYSADTTYFVSGNVYNLSSVTMESAVFKYPTNSSYLEIEGALTMATTNYRPAIFTAADDNTAGTTLSTNIWSGYTGNPSGKHYGNMALWLNTGGNIALNNTRFCYQNCAIGAWPPSTSDSLEINLSDSEMVLCTYGVSAVAGESGGSGDLTLYANNCLMSQVSTPFTNSGSVYASYQACNCTIDSSADLFVINSSGECELSVYNSILSKVSSNGPPSYISGA